MKEGFDCFGYIGSTNYVPPHRCSDKQSVMINDERYSNVRMCYRCYGIYQEEMGINNTIQEVMKQEDLEGILQEAGEEE